MIEFGLLGPTWLAGGRSARADLDEILAQPRRTALLAYLLLARPGAGQQREHLLTVFWPEFSPSRGRAALRRALSFLRTRLGRDALITRGREVVELAPERIRCDALLFEKALADGRAEDALELYRGPLLDGFFARGAPDFERWTDVERGRLERAAAGAAVELATAAEEAGDRTVAAAWLRRALEITPSDEQTLGRLMSVLARGGARHEALRVYQSFARHMADTYELEPSAGTRQLVAAIVEGGMERRMFGRRSRGWARRESRDLVAEAWTLAERTRSDNERAVRLFQRAIRLDDSCAEAYAGLAAANSHGVQLFGRSRADIAENVRAARTAVSLDPSFPEGYFALGLALETAGRLAEAEGAYSASVSLDPSSGPTASQLGRVVMYGGNFAEALRWARQSYQLAPEDAHTSLQIGVDLFCLGLDDEADRWCETTLDTWPEFLWAEAAWAYLALANGDLREAQRRVGRMTNHDPDSFLGRFTGGMTALVAGAAADAREIFESLYALDPSSRHTALFLSTRACLAYLKLQEGDRSGADALLREAERENIRALGQGCTFGGIFYDQVAVHALRGDEERALDWLEASNAAGFRQPGYTRRDPLLEPLRRHDRFGRILQAIEADIRDQREAAAPLFRRG